MKILLKTLIVWLSAAFALGAAAQTLSESQLADIHFDQKLGAQVSLDLNFRDETGRNVTLADYLGKKPVVLVLGYYSCPMLCTLTFNGMVEGMNDMKWSIGDEFNVVHISINPKETPELAAAKRQNYLKQYGRPDAAAGWHFLIGDEPQIRKLADEVGFQYAYDSSVQQYAHPSGLVILTPDGKVSKYFFGVKFSPPELYTSLQDASRHSVGSPIQRLVLLCFHYNPIKGKYGAVIMTTIRIMGAATILGIGWLFAAMIRREPRIRKITPATPVAAHSLPDQPRSV
jgi:protein SCO1/2